MPPTRKLMKLKSTMVDEPDPGPPTQVLRAPPASSKKSWLKREPESPAPAPAPQPVKRRSKPKKNVSEAAASYVTDDKPSQAKTWTIAAAITVVLFGVQVVANGDSGLQVSLATAYVYLTGAMMLWLLWQAFMESMQRLAIFIGMPVCWMVVMGMLEQLPAMGYFILFTIFAYLAYFVDYIVRECKSQVFKIAASSFTITLGTELYFLLSDEQFLSHLGSFPTLKMAIEPVIKGGGMLRSLLS